jgi:hypothetical protein
VKDSTPIVDTSIKTHVEQDLKATGDGGSTNTFVSSTGSTSTSSTTSPAGSSGSSNVINGNLNQSRVIVKNTVPDANTSLNANEGLGLTASINGNDYFDFSKCGNTNHQYVIQPVSSVNTLLNVADTLLDVNVGLGLATDTSGNNSCDSSKCDNANNGNAILPVSCPNTAHETVDTSLNANVWLGIATSANDNSTYDSSSCDNTSSEIVTQLLSSAQTVPEAGKR